MLFILYCMVECRSFFYFGLIVSDVVIVYSVRCIGMYGSSYGYTLFNIGGIRSGASSGFGCVVIRDEDDVGVENNTHL